MERDNAPNGPEKELLIEALQYPTRSVDVDAAVVKIQALTKQKNKPSLLSRPYVPRIIGITALTVIAVFGVKYIPDTREHTTTTKTYTTAPAQRAKVQLADGTEMLLGPATVAKVTGRRVQLTGSALFTVTHDNGDPFIVYTSGIPTRVLGTSFSVRHYKGETSTQVVVAQGRVALANTVLNTGDMGSAGSEKSVLVTHDVNVATALAWADGKLVFNNTALRDAIPELERWYGIAVKVNDERLLAREVTTTLSTESASEAADLLAPVLEAHAELKGSTITFSIK